MDTGAWQATIHDVHKESDMTEDYHILQLKKKSFFRTSDIKKVMQISIFSFLLKNIQNQRENEKENPQIQFQLY